jgi:hypothetical protein
VKQPRSLPWLWRVPRQGRSGARQQGAEPAPHEEGGRNTRARPGRPRTRRARPGGLRRCDHAARPGEAQAWPRLHDSLVGPVPIGAVFAFIGVRHRDRLVGYAQSHLRGMSGGPCSPPPHRRGRDLRFVADPGDGTDVAAQLATLAAGAAHVAVPGSRATTAGKPRHLGREAAPPRPRRGRGLGAGAVPRFEIRPLCRLLARGAALSAANSRVWRTFRTSWC